MTESLATHAMAKLQRDGHLLQPGELEPGQWFSPFPWYMTECDNFYKVKSISYDYNDHSVTIKVCWSAWYKPWGKKFRIPAHEYIDFSSKGQEPLDPWDISAG